jgi:putative phosphoesterase
MRLAVLSDIHANLPALEAVLADMQQYAVNGAIIAGDLTAGPQPVETIRLIRSIGGWMIRGNSDNNLLRYAAGDAPTTWRTSRQYSLLRWGYDHVDAETLEFIRSLPEQRVVAIEDTAHIRVVHGSPRSPYESIYPDRDPASLDSALAQVDEPVFICGHTHQPWKVERAGRLAFNPGAVCGPLNGDVRAQYAVLTWDDDDRRWQVEHQAVPYDLDRIRSAFRESGLLEEGGALARSFLLSIEIGQNVVDDFLAYAYGLAARAGFKDCTIVPDEIWGQAAATWDWDRAANSKR